MKGIEFKFEEKIISSAIIGTYDQFKVKGSIMDFINGNSRTFEDRNELTETNSGAREMFCKNFINLVRN